MLGWPWFFFLPIVMPLAHWLLRRRRGAASPNWTGQYVQPKDLPASVRQAFDEGRTFRCGFDVRRPRSWVVSGPFGRCVVASDAIACQMARMTFAVVRRDSVHIVVRRGKILTQRVDVTDGSTEVWITPYDWDAAKQLLLREGWPVPDGAA